MEEKLCRRNHGGAIMEEDSWRRNRGGGIMEDESWRVHHGGGIMEEAARRRQPGEGTRRHPGAPGATQETPGAPMAHPGGRTPPTVGQNKGHRRAEHGPP